jgi:hypothetical protein
MRSEEYDRNVFINCPFDADYAPLFEAIVNRSRGRTFVALRWLKCPEMVELPLRWFNCL